MCRANFFSLRPSPSASSIFVLCILKLFEELNFFFKIQVLKNSLLSMLKKLSRLKKRLRCLNFFLLCSKQIFLMKQMDQARLGLSNYSNMFVMKKVQYPILTRWDQVFQNEGSHNRHMGNFLHEQALASWNPYQGYYESDARNNLGCPKCTHLRILKPP